MRDRGLWITWYDLPESARDEYLSWLYESYIPRMLSKPRVLWAAHYASVDTPPMGHIRHTTDPAVPSGNEYVLMFGAETPHAFSKGAEAYIKGARSKLEADLSSRDDEMLALRRCERVVITTEEERIDGPEIGKGQDGDLTPGPCIQLGSYNGGSPEVEDELLAWYADWRMHAMSELPGCVRMRKMVSVSGWAKHLVMYEFASVEARASNLPALKERFPEQLKWTEQWIPKLTHAPRSPLIAERVWPAVKRSV